MSEIYAEDFYGISEALSENLELRDEAIVLIEADAIPGKATEGGNRLQCLRQILISLVNGDTALQKAYGRIEVELPRGSSIYSGDNRVFATGWEERLVRTQLSRFYNQAVLDRLRTRKHTTCYVPHSGAEDSGSRCSQQLAGQHHDAELMYQRLVRGYRDGDWSDRSVKIPEHPHCTHLITPPR